MHIHGSESIYCESMKFGFMKMPIYIYINTNIVNHDSKMHTYRFES